MIYDNSNHEYENTDRIIVIGDIHGDIKRLITILTDSKVINQNLEWIADPPNTYVVQVGDQIDSINRSPDIPEWEKLKDIETIHFTNFLDKMAMVKGGRFISLIGNHELMNVQGVFDYVSKKSTFTNRHNYFKPQGYLSLILASRPIVLKIGDLIFCHAGIRKHHLDIVEKNNTTIFELNNLWKKYMLNNKVENTELFEKIIVDSENGILWTRKNDSDEDNKYVMDKLNCTYMFVGHSPSNNIQLIQSSIWYVDSAISRSFGQNQYEYLEINNYHITIKSISDNI